MIMNKKSRIFSSSVAKLISNLMRKNNKKDTFPTKSWIADLANGVRDYDSATVLFFSFASHIDCLQPKPAQTW